MRRLTLLVYASGILGPFSGAAVLSLVPSLKAGFDVTAAEAVVALTAFMLPSALLQLVSGAVADAAGRRSVLLAGFGLYSVGSALCTFALDWNLFLGGRVAMGLGFALFMPVLPALLGESVDHAARGRAFGVFGAVLTAGLALGPLTAGFLAAWNWRLAFGLLAVIGVAFTFLWLPALPRDAHHAALAERLRATARGLGAAVADARVLLLCLLGAAAFFVVIGSTTFLADWLSLPPRSAKESEIGFVVAAWGFAGVLFSPLAGRLVDGFGRRSVAAAGFALALLPLAFMRMATGLGEFVLLVFALGAALTLVWTPLLTLSVELQPERKATVSSLFNGVRFLGYAVAPVALAPAYGTRNLDAVLLLLVAVSGVAALLVPLLGKARASTPAT